MQISSLESISRQTDLKPAGTKWSLGTDSKMGFWHWIIFLIAHNKDPINGDRRNIDSSWYDVVLFVQNL